MKNMMYIEIFKVFSRDNIDPVVPYPVDLHHAGKSVDLDS